MTPTVVSDGMSARLSVPRVAKYPFRPITEAEHSTLRSVADALIPAHGGLPGAGSVADFDALCDTALAVIGPHFDSVMACVKTIGEDGGAVYDRLRELHFVDPQGFYWLSWVVLSIYLASDEAEALNYPKPHRNRPSFTQAADELTSGILDNVISRGPLFAPTGERLGANTPNGP